MEWQAKSMKSVLYPATTAKRKMQVWPGTTIFGRVSLNSIIWEHNRKYESSRQKGKPAVEEEAKGKMR
ncbi:hypothetical protein E1B28_010943 [Marasmius oreades]|uniref:Uncharacterized protein n=1 Tax=Marasmius oreades TaxID=181124 RepID=A0A9P7RT20_9AGAR|nr:uncharacterized protein E1B28_010943 [Marasmius oreades]KAG7089244.1 hypothetical protein E1B28_010943 [Marasmius oreades]